MMHHTASGSDMLRLRQSLAEEYAAAQRGLTGLALGTATHAFITARIERMQQYQEEVIALVGFEQGMHLVTEVLETTSGDDSGCGTQEVQPDRKHVSPVFDDRDEAMQTDAADVSGVNTLVHPGASSADVSGCFCKSKEGGKLFI